MPSEQPGLILPNVDQRLQAHAEKQMLLNQLRWQWAGQCMAHIVQTIFDQRSLVPDDPNLPNELGRAAKVSFMAADAMLAEMGHKPVHLKKQDAAKPDE